MLKGRLAGRPFSFLMTRLVPDEREVILGVTHRPEIISRGSVNRFPVDDAGPAFQETSPREKPLENI